MLLSRDNKHKTYGYHQQNIAQRVTVERLHVKVMIKMKYSEWIEMLKPVLSI